MQIAARLSAVSATPPIPDSALETHIGILGKVGSGKSYSARGLVERLLRLGRQVVVIDPTGAWWGLRLNPAGTGPGIDIPIFGGEHGDVPISDAAGEAVATVIVEQRTSAVVDLSEMGSNAQTRFMTAFAHRLRAKRRSVFYLVIDEADEFLPQNLPKGETNLFGDLRWIVRRARINGFRVIMITQRPAEIAKAVLTQIETLVVHRLTAPQDRRAIEEWVKGHHDPAEAREVLTTLAGLEQGEAWVWSPDLNLLTRSRQPLITTFDSSRTPEAGEDDRPTVKLAALDLSAIRAALEAPIAGKAKAVMPSAAGTAEVERLRHQLSDLTGQLSATEHERDIADLRAATAEKRVAAALEALRGECGPVSAKVPPPPKAPPLPPAPAEVPPQPAQRARSPATAGQPLQRVINTLAWWRAAGFPRIDRRRACLLAGYSPKASTFGVYIARLINEGFVEAPEPGMLGLTSMGIGLAAVPEFGDGALIDAAGVHLSEPERRVFQAVVSAYPNSISRSDLADHLGYSRIASTLGVYIAKSVSFGFIESSRGAVRAADWLFSGNGSAT